MVADTLPDTQATLDERNIVIHKAGIKSLRYPLSIDVEGASLATVGVWSMYVGVPAPIKGAHMSRFLESLEAHADTVFSLGSFVALEAEMRERMDQAREGKIEVHFPVFMRKTAPVSGVSSLLDYDVTVEVESTEAFQGRVRLTVKVPVKSLCPCSKKISDYGAHNQRSHIHLSAEVCAPLAWQELIRIAEEEASSEIFALLKRADEKWVTERAYENPKFVEDLVRDLALRMQTHPSIGEFTVSAENFESIHNHSAYAEIQGVGAFHASMGGA
jgi:GTP cyclohydrolase I